MIGKLRGIVDSTGDHAVILDVGGVGYEVHCPARTLAALAPGEAAILLIETHLREDALTLYGFEKEEDRHWFRLLHGVQRVGARLALAILSALPPSALAQAILAKDTRTLGRISGVGPKLAERLVIELKDKAALAPSSSGPKLVHSAAFSPSSSQDEVIAALSQLGYSRSEAYAAAAEAVRQAGDGAAVEELVKRSLKALAR